MDPKYSDSMDPWTFIWTNLKHHVLMMLIIQIRTVVLLLILLQKIFKVFLHRSPYQNFGPQVLGPYGPMDHHLNKFESPPNKDHPYQVWSGLAQWFQRRKLKCELFTDDGLTHADPWQKLTLSFGPGQLKLREDLTSREKCDGQTEAITISHFLWNYWGKNDLYGRATLVRNKGMTYL